MQSKLCFVGNLGYSGSVFLTKAWKMAAAGQLQVVFLLLATSSCALPWTKTLRQPTLRLTGFSPRTLCLQDSRPAGFLESSGMLLNVDNREYEESNTRLELSCPLHRLRIERSNILQWLPQAGFEATRMYPML